MQRRFTFPYFHLAHACWRFAGEKRRNMVIFHVLTLCANLAIIAQPYVIGRLINALQAGGPDLWAESLYWLSLYAAMVVIFWLFHGPSRIIERALAFHVKCAFLQYCYDMLTRLPMRWHRDHHSGATVNRITKAAGGLYAFSELQFIYIESVVRVVGAFAMLAYVSPSIAGIELAFACVIIFLLTRFDKVLVSLYDRRNEREHDYSAAFFDYIGNIASVIAFNLAAHTRRALGGMLSAVGVPLRKELYLNEVKWCVLMLLIVAAEFIVMMYYIADSLGQNALMLGTLVTVYQYMNTLNNVFYGFAGNYQTLIQQHTDFAAAEPLTRDFTAESLHDEGKPALAVSAAQIEFRELHFTYPGGRHVFDGLNLHISPHQKVGLVGRSGAGKTTLAQLLLRFYETAGTIAVDGQDIRSVTHESLCESVAVIPQDATLFETSLMENIRCGRLNATDEEVIEAARKAHAHEFIAQIPEGYAAQVGERGVKLSGGQRQRVAIARAILKNAPILVLDEATSALDSESERYIQESLEDLMEGKTVIAIAHRLSTISHLDRLVVLDHGRIVEDGSHRELLARGGYYASLWAMQSGGFLPD